MNCIHVHNPGGLDNLKTGTLEPRAPGPGEIQVRVHASSLNFHDYVVAVGLLPVDNLRIPMSDGAGVVQAVGEGVTKFATGDHVMSTFFPDWADGRADDQGKINAVPGDTIDGFAAETVTMPERAFTRAPKGYNHEQAATLPCAALTAWRAVAVEAKVKAGDTVLVQGSGGVSIFALQFAKAHGCSVIATSSSDEKLEKMRALGADETINYKETPEWGARTRELTDGRGVDLIVEVGGSGTLPQSIGGIAMGGHISMIGVLTGFSGDVPTAALFQKNAVIHGITVGSQAHQLDMINAIEANNILPVIDTSFPLDGIADAFRFQESQGHFGKICLSY